MSKPEEKAHGGEGPGPMAGEGADTGVSEVSCLDKVGLSESDSVWFD